MLPSPFGKEISFVALRSGETIDFALRPEEQAALSPLAAEKRRAEFYLGRAAAFLALKNLGLENPPPVTKGEKREPIFPKDIVGSLSHQAGVAVAAVAYIHDALGLGVDVETIDQQRNLGILSHIAHPAEALWVGSASENEKLGRLIRLFSAKECVFKALFPLCLKYFGFKDVELSYDASAEAFHCELRANLAPALSAGSTFSILSQQTGRFILSSLKVTRA